MKLTIAIVLFILCLFNRRSKFVLLLTIIGLWFLFINCGETLDSQNYINEFSHLSLANATKEPLYVMIVLFFRSLGIQYDLYHAITSAIAILIIGWATYKLASNYNLALGVFLIYPFALYVVQIRNCFAFSICMIAFVFLNKNNDGLDKRSWIGRYKYELIYIFFVLCASLIHSVYIVFLLFLLAEKFDLKRVIIITVILIAVESVIMNKTILLRVAELFGVKARLGYALYWQAMYGQSDISFRVIVTFIMYLCVFSYLSYQIRSNEDAISIQRYNQNQFALKLNILSLVILPVVPIIREVFRIQEALMLLNYIFITNNMDTQISWKRDTLRNSLIIATLLLFVFVDDWLYILRFDQMREYVLHAVFG